MGCKQYYDSQERRFRQFNEVISLPLDLKQKRRITKSFIVRMVENDIKLSLNKELIEPLVKSLSKLKW